VTAKATAATSGKATAVSNAPKFSEPRSTPIMSQHKDTHRPATYNKTTRSWDYPTECHPDDGMGTRHCNTVAQLSQAIQSTLPEDIDEAIRKHPLTQVVLSLIDEIAQCYDPMHPEDHPRDHKLLLQAAERLAAQFLISKRAGDVR
jgi:hypothetical protein